MNKLLGIFCIVIAALGGMLFISMKKAAKMEKNWKTAMANVKAYDEELSSSKEKNTAYQLTVAQLETFKDSILMELNETKEELKIKNSKLKSMQYVSSTFVVNDTIQLTDTIFKEPEFKMDTVLGDEWYTVQLGLKYPSEVAVNPSFKSVKHIVVSNKKETVNPRKKFFIARWFQKKHVVLHVDVVEKNPYATDEKSKYVEIIK